MHLLVGNYADFCVFYIYNAKKPSDSMNNSLSFSHCNTCQI